MSSQALIHLFFSLNRVEMTFFVLFYLLSLTSRVRNLRVSERLQLLTADLLEREDVLHLEIRTELLKAGLRGSAPPNRP